MLLRELVQVHTLSLCFVLSKEAVQSSQGPFSFQSSEYLDISIFMSTG